MRFTEQMVDNYAEKLLIGLTREENKMTLDEFEEIDRSIDMALNTVKGLESVEPMSWCIERDDYTFRDDVAEESISQDKILANCDDKSGDVIRVPKVV